MSRALIEVLQRCMRRVILERPKDREIPDPVPIHIPGDERPPTLREEMQRFIREEISRAAIAGESGHGSFEEEDDFEIEDGDNDLTTAYTIFPFRLEEETGYEVSKDGDASEEEKAPSEAAPDGHQEGPGEGDSLPGEPQAGTSVQNAKTA